jgi:hypothetical protein
MQNNVAIFPLIKKFNLDQEIDFEKIPKDEIEKISYHYTEQLLKMFTNHGFPNNGSFLNDAYFLNDVIESMLLRSIGKHHPIQDLVDSFSETEEEELEDDTC